MKTTGDGKGTQILPEDRQPSQLEIQIRQVWYDMKLTIIVEIQSNKLTRRDVTSKDSRFMSRPQNEVSINSPFSCIDPVCYSR